MTRIAGLAVRARCRVVLDNDWSGDPDGLLALAHHLLSPANRVVAVTSSFLNPRFPASESKAADGAAVAAELLDQLALPVQPVVYAGAEQPIAAGAAASPASDAIVVEARREDGLPLYVACGGPLTNVAAAVQAAPDIAGRMTVLWIGGSLADGRFEYNHDTDPGPLTWCSAIRSSRSTSSRWRRTDGVHTRWPSLRWICRRAAGWVRGCGGGLPGRCRIGSSWVRCGRWVTARRCW
jgi:hypothetical protein